MMGFNRIALWAAIILTFIFIPVSEAANFVSREQVDLVRLLGPPPADQSPQTRTEILELLQLQQIATPQDRDAAAADDRISVFQFASSILGPRFTVANLPLTEELFRRLSKDAISLFVESKDQWNRTRPARINGEIKPCSDHASSGAYPSGHSTCGYLTAIVLAEMLPEKKPEIFERAGQYARNRMVCGVHYRSDIEAGQIAGTVIAAFAMQNPRFRKDFEEARKEVRTLLGLP